MTAEKDAAIFNDFVFGDGHCFDRMLENALKLNEQKLNAEQDEDKKTLLKKEIKADIKYTIEAASRTVAGELSDGERDNINDALFEKLRIAKEANPRPRRRDLLEIDDIAVLVDVIAHINKPLAITVIKKIKEARNLEETNAALYSRAWAGTGSVGTEPKGIVGAILTYEKTKGEFSTLLWTIIRNALGPTQPEKNIREWERELDNAKRDKSDFLSDRKIPAPYKRIMQQSMLDALDDCVEHLQVGDRAAGKYIIDTVKETGKMPMFQDIATHLGLIPHYRNVFRHVQDIFERLGEIMSRHYPQLYGDGINGWDRFKEIIDGYAEKSKLQDKLREDRNRKHYKSK